MKYSVLTHEPCYPDSTETVGGELTLHQALSLVARKRREYLKDPENNPSYAEIWPAEGYEGKIGFVGNYFLDSPFNYFLEMGNLAIQIKTIRNVED